MLAMYGNEVTEPIIVSDCGRSGPVVSYTDIPMQAGNNIHYTAKKSVSCYRSDVHFYRLLHECTKGIRYF